MPHMGKLPSFDKLPPVKPVPLYDILGQNAPLRRDLERAALRVLRSGAYILGPEGAAFEAAFAKLQGARHCVGVSSGTSALHLALLALEAGPGDGVMTAPFTFIGTTIAAVAAGAKIQFCDVRPDTLTLDPEDAARRLTSATKVLMPVHLYGHPADMTAIMALARRKGLKVVEDAAQAHLTEHKGKKIGALGDIGCFSFYVTKNLGAMGDAGACTTDDPALDRKLRILRNNGSDPVEKYRHPLQGYNARLDELQAAFLRIKLARLARWTARRRALARLYREKLSGLPLALPPEGAPGDAPTYHLFTVRTPERGALQAHLKEQGVSSAVYYPIPLHLQEAYQGLGYKAGDFPHAEKACREVLSLPLFPELTDAQARRVAAAVRGFFKR
jgi:dTDP-4-amino-4,6-dideoxygalactose transaminase